MINIKNKKEKRKRKKKDERMKKKREGKMIHLCGRNVKVKCVKEVFTFNLVLPIGHQHVTSSLTPETWIALRA